MTNKAVYIVVDCLSGEDYGPVDDPFILLVTNTFFSPFVSLSISSSEKYKVFPSLLIFIFSPSFAYFILQ